MAVTARSTTSITFSGELEVLGSTTLVRLPPEASAELPSRGQVAVRGTLDEHPFETVMEPDGRRGHWLRVDAALARAAGAAEGDEVHVVVEVAEEWPEPDVPADLAAALDGAPEKIQGIWEDITPMARWEWVRWVGATRNPETRAKRVGVSIDKMDHGKRRPCCFDLSSCTEPDVARSGKLPERS
jgi:Domain of unknown function (DUF1905)/Bacteriocin-protection, YdeI or OmpD-Associated